MKRMMRRRKNKVKRPLFVHVGVWVAGKLELSTLWILLLSQFRVKRIANTNTQYKKSKHTYRYTTLCPIPARWILNTLNVICIITMVIMRIDHVCAWLVAFFAPFAMSALCESVSLPREPLVYQLASFLVELFQLCFLYLTLCWCLWWKNILTTRLCFLGVCCHFLRWTSFHGILSDEIRFAIAQCFPFRIRQSHIFSWFTIAECPAPCCLL